MYRTETSHHSMAEDWRSLLRRWYAGFKQWMMTNPRNELVWHTVGIEMGPKDLESSRRKVDSDELSDDDLDWLSDQPWRDETWRDCSNDEQPCRNRTCRD